MSNKDNVSLDNTRTQEIRLQGVKKLKENRSYHHSIPPICSEIITNCAVNPLQLNIENVEIDSRKYIKALISRQRRTDECIDIANIRTRTQKFDSKKEATLPSNELDERGRPKSEPFDSYITTQLVETTFNCTEYIGIAELLDTITALSSATCSKKFPR